MTALSGGAVSPAGPRRGDQAWRSIRPSFPQLISALDTGGGSAGAGRRVVIVAWRDVASPQAGGSELLVDQLAAGLTARGDQVTLICGGPAAAHDYDVVRSGGPYTQFAGAPFAYARRLRDCDVVVEVCNGMPFLAPLWSRKPMVCMVNHVHTDLWALRFPRRYPRWAGSWSSGSCRGLTAAAWC